MIFGRKFKQSMKKEIIGEGTTEIWGTTEIIKLTNSLTSPLTSIKRISMGVQWML